MFQRDLKSGLLKVMMGLKNATKNDVSQKTGVIALGGHTNNGQY